MVINLRADCRQNRCKFEYIVVFCAVANLTKEGVVFVLLAFLDISPCRLNMSVGLRANLDFMVGRRDRQLANAIASSLPSSMD